MKNFSLKYGRKEINIHLPGEAVLLEPMEKPQISDESETLTLSLENPINSPKLENFIRPSDKVLIIIPDKTRKARVDFVLKFIVERISSKNIAILFANGTHTSQTENEKREILGDEFYSNFKVFENDAFNGQFIYFGRTSRGTEIFLNELVSQSDKLIIVGPITHHYFAGFGGGAKMLIPGVASYQTAVQNHKLTLTPNGDLNPNTTNLKLDGNPVYEDILEGFKLCNLKVFYLGVILDDSDRIIFSVSGDLIDAHRLGCAFLEKYFTISIEEKFDLVISSAGGFPKDVNFIQSHKAIHHSWRAVKEGGKLITFAECRDGIGSKTFLDWFKFGDIEQMKSELVKNYSMNGHTALSLRMKLKSVKISLVTELDDETVSLLGLEKLKNEIEISELVRIWNVKRIAVIKNASIYLPKT